MPPNENQENPNNQDSQAPTASNAPTTPLEAPEAPASPSTPEAVNNTTPLNTENKGKIAENEQNTQNTLENQEVEKIPKTEETPKAQEPQTTQSESGTAQTPVNEPLAKVSLARELLIKARNAIQFRKRKKLDKIMTLFLKKSKISNQDISEFLHVSDATATRYLDILEKENKIKQTGKTGHAVSYSRI